MACDPGLSETGRVGLGGDEEGVIGVDEGVKKTPLLLRKRGRMAFQKQSPSVGLRVFGTILLARNETERMPYHFLKCLKRSYLCFHF